jgi:hypothetical protein
MSLPRHLALPFAAAALLAGCGGSSGEPSASSPTPAATTPAPSPTLSTRPTTVALVDQAIDITVADGKVTPAPGRVDVEKGDKVALTVTSDVADEVHVHGYNLMKDVEAGGSVTITFTADLSGVWEVELESRKLQLTELQVQ